MDDQDDIIVTPSGYDSDNNVRFDPPRVENLQISEELVQIPISPACNVDHDSSIEDSSDWDIASSQDLYDVKKSPIAKHDFFPIPQMVNFPIGNYYSNIKWDNGFDRWNIVRFATPMDNNCLFHAIANSFFEPYHTEILNGKHIDRRRMIIAMRKELSHKLASKVSEVDDSPTYYETLNGGNTSAFAQNVPEFSLSNMQFQLQSQVPIGYGYMEFIGNALNKDIYILEAIRHDIYITDELPLTIKGDRSSIVLYYMNGHYELVGIMNLDGSFDTHFSPDHSFIRFLYDRVDKIISP
jgi:hypothetical protein